MVGCGTPGDWLAPDLSSMSSLNGLFHGCVVFYISATPKGVANYFLLVLVTRGIASFASLIRSSPRYVAGTPEGVLQYLKKILIGRVSL